ncbi:hypothetical protein [Hymenobacter cavernae]|uniref:Uncharacterized protein n=1 Tax=Hymenobacter cavernae TaxID=2044852 RepID=A0ABQ1UI82_9BACT|nr:hypothetical protein [Hymenobacter cavernae]GGF19717.1 hypothetical protein GCM10011383_34140 [Hymenobacter cavernae]
MADATLFDPYAGEFFSDIEEPKSWTKRYRQEHPALDENNQPKNPLYSTYFSKEFVEAILNQTRPADSPCVGLRIYRGTDSNQKQHTILVGVDPEGKDILYAAAADGTPSIEEVMVGNYGKACPPSCNDTSSALATD